MSSEEIVQIVDEQNEPCAAVSRKIMRRERLIHRASYILVFNRQGQLFLQRRTMTKDIYPGYWDVAAGGVVLAGESYEESARRELQEELGVPAKKLRHCFDHYYQDADNRVWGRIFSCTSEGPFTLQAEEVMYGQFYGVDEALALSHYEPFTPDGVEVLQRWQQEVAG